jgi:hypothetical protein
VQEEIIAQLDIIYGKDAWQDKIQVMTNAELSKAPYNVSIEGVAAGEGIKGTHIAINTGSSDIRYGVNLAKVESCAGKLAP